MKKRLLFYCQHLLGVGHLTRSLALCEALADGFEVDLLQGGPDVGIGLERPGLRTLKLPPLLMREEDSTLYDPSGAAAPAEVFALRRAALERVLAESRYDHLVVELFPFGRWQFRKELGPFIDRARALNPGLRAHCSLRDILIERPEARRRETLEALRARFDSVLVHSDPRLIRLEETFPEAAEIVPPVVYTGFVAPRARPGERERASRVVVSLGGGAVGARLAEAAARAAGRLPGYEFRVLLGPNTPEADRALIAKAARGRPNVRLSGFSADFAGELASARLSVSLAGYNTVMDLLRTRTRGVVHPYGANREQALRARRFERAGLVAVAGEEELDGARLAALLERELARPYPALEADLSGADKTREYLLEEKR